MKTKILGKYLFLTLLVGVLTACGSDDRRLRDRAAIESQEAARKAIEEDNKNKEQWAVKMEEDLEKRYAFYEAYQGTYIGEIPMETTDFEVRLNLRLNQTSFEPGRVRTVDEIREELERLSFTAEVTLSSVEGYTSAGCVFEETRPNLKTGDIFLASEECKQVYDFSIADEELLEEMRKRGDLKESRAFNSEAEYQVRELEGTIRFLLRSGEYNFAMVRH